MLRTTTLTLIASFALTAPAWAVSAPAGIEQSERYRALKAEMVLSGHGSGRELIVEGRRVDDLELAMIAGDEALVAKLSAEQTQRRLIWGGIAAAGLPAGGFLVSQVSSKLYQPAFSVGTGGVSAQGLDFGSFLVGAAGTLCVIYGLVYAVNLANDLFGLERPPLLNDTEAKALVDRYNTGIKTRLLQELEPQPSASGMIMGWSRSF